MVYFLLLLALASIALYVGLMLREVPGFAEQRLGQLEELPEAVGKWCDDDTSPEGRAASARGELRQVRHLYDPDGGFFSGGSITRQVRYRALNTHEILRTEPEQVTRRRRVKKPG